MGALKGLENNANALAIKSLSTREHVQYRGTDTRNFREAWNFTGVN